MITIVSGFQRCGSSLMMQMLAAGGMPVFHDDGMGYPAFETQAQLHDAGNPAWMNAIDGYAVKWLEPMRQMPPVIAPTLRVLWMTRDHREQAKSAVKFMRACGIIVPSDARKGFEASYRRDESRSVDLWCARTFLLRVKFETLIEQPRATAERVKEFLAAESLDVEAMAGEVFARPTRCLDGLLELALMERKR